MTYSVGDDGAVVYPVVDSADPPGDLNFPAVVTARRWLGDTESITASWLGAPGPQRELRVPLSGLTGGLWTLRLVTSGEADLVLGKVVID